MISSWRQIRLCPCFPTQMCSAAGACRSKSDIAQTIVKDHVGQAEQLGSPQRQQSRIARAGTNQINTTSHVTAFCTTAIESGQRATGSPYYATQKRSLKPVTYPEIRRQRASDPDMPNTPSAKKRLRQNDKRRLQNRSAKSSMRTQIRRLREAVQSGDSEKAQTEFQAVQKRIDQAASKKLIHKNAAARTKSRLSKLVKAVG